LGLVEDEDFFFWIYIKIMSGGVDSLVLVLVSDDYVFGNFCDFWKKNMKMMMVLMNVVLKMMKKSEDEDEEREN